MENYYMMIQNIIKRMNENSFSLKKIAVTLFTAQVLFSSIASTKKSLIVATVLAITIWFLDSYYLYIERRYRDMYKQVIADNTKELNYNLELSKISISKKIVLFIESAFSITEFYFYLMLVLVTLLSKIL